MVSSSTVHSACVMLVSSQPMSAIVMNGTSGPPGTEKGTAPS